MRYKLVLTPFFKNESTHLKFFSDVEIYKYMCAYCTLYRELVVYFTNKLMWSVHENI